MSEDPLTPPATLSTELADTLKRYSGDQVKHVARYAGVLTEHKKRETREENEA